MKYIINGKEINMQKKEGEFLKLRDPIILIYELLEALNEKKEECKPECKCESVGCLRCTKEEPKSMCNACYDKEPLPCKVKSCMNYGEEICQCENCNTFGSKTATHRSEEEPKSNKESIVFDGAGKNPKSTLKEEISDIIFGVHKYPELADFTNDLTKFQTNLYADKIISLFKDTLLKEVKKAEPLRLQGESTDFTQGQEWTMTQIKQIIKNI